MNNLIKRPLIVAAMAGAALFGTATAADAADVHWSVHLGLPLPPLPALPPLPPLPALPTFAAPAYAAPQGAGYYSQGSGYYSQYAEPQSTYYPAPAQYAAPVYQTPAVVYEEPLVIYRGGQRYYRPHYYEAGRNAWDHGHGGSGHGDHRGH